MKVKKTVPISSMIYSLSQEFKKVNSPNLVGLLITTHLLRDRPDFLNGLVHAGFEVSVLSIPYSEIPGIRSHLDSKVRISSPQSVWPPSLDFLYSLVNELLNRADKFVLLDIGGYWSTYTQVLKEKYAERFLGIVEDTEAGHRRYLMQPALFCPVVSVARSPLKECEDVLVGTSIVSSVDNIMRSMERPLKGLQILVIGFGKIGRAVSQELWHRGNYVSVLDSNPIRKALAMSLGYKTPERSLAFQSSDIVIGVTGSTSVSRADLKEIREECILVSGSSRNIEFEISSEEFVTKTSIPLEGTNHWVTEIAINGNRTWLVDHGTPVNFPDAAVIGPSLQLAQIEMVFAVFKLIDGFFESSGITELEQLDREMIAETWINLQF